MVILPEERGYIAGRARLYSRKSAVIFPEERGYMEEERGYICVMKIEVTAFPCCRAPPAQRRSDQKIMFADTWIKYRLAA